MKKSFDSVKFQRERRTRLSAKLADMSPKEMVKYFQTMPSPPPRPVRSRATAHNKRNKGARNKSRGD